MLTVKIRSPCSWLYTAVVPILQMWSWRQRRNLSKNTEQMTGEQVSDPMALGPHAVQGSPTCHCLVPW